MQQRLTSLELHRERVQSTVEWMRDVDSKNHDESLFMTTVSYDKPKRLVGVPQTFDKSCEFSNIEPDPRSMVGGRVMAFRRETLDTFADEMMEMLSRANEYDRTHSTKYGYTTYACMHIWAQGQRRLGTRSIGITPENMNQDLDYLYNVEFMNMINEIEQAQHHYEVVFEADGPCYVHFYFKVQYYPEPGCVANWGDVNPMENLKLFDLFTASNKDNCILQCAQRIWPVDLDSPDESRHKEATEDCIAKMINRAEGKIVILTPRAYIRNIRNIHNYGDVTFDPLSPVKDMSVIDPRYIYLLHWKNHIGVMENVKTEMAHPLYTKFRPLQKFPSCKKLTVCFDIECYFDPESDTQHVPYLCCACFVYDNTPGNVIEFKDRDCVAKMVEWSAHIAVDYGHSNVELVAHNGGGYDFHYILSSMHNPSAVYDILIRNNHIIGFKFDFDDVVFSVKDSLNFLLCSLSKAAKAFLPAGDPSPCESPTCASTGEVGKCEHSCCLPSLDKTDFPHHEARSEEDLQRTFQEWTRIEQNIGVNVEKERMLITVDHTIRYSVHGESKRLIDWAKEYCCNDVIVLAHVWVRFKQTVANIFNCHIVDQTMTLAGLSFRLFEAHLPANVRLYHPNKSDFENMRESLIGGRCISVNGLWHDVLCLDVKSLYPAAMAYYDQPYGPYSKVKTEVKHELGIYHVRVTINGNGKGHGFFPIRQGAGAVSYNTGGKNHGVVGWHTKGVLYKLKLKYEDAGDKEKRQVIKIIMNSLWGKFAQKWMDTQYKIVREEEADLNNECYKIWDTDHMLVKKHKNKKRSSKPVQNGVFVLSWARWHMKMLWDAVTLPDAECLYSDTDSIMVDKKVVRANATVVIDGQTMPALGEQMGQLQVENNFDDLICVGKKQYIGSYLHDGKTVYKKRFKGVPNHCIRPEMYAHLLKDPSNKVQIDFLKFKREWGTVHGYIESKVVTQT
ncbi:hypothetical protein EV175_004028 [Coemansia sp. RSA 1933]|nr:hypothetical protein EV175_004028 [Coemansia sp. RSA 1933]